MIYMIVRAFWFTAVPVPSTARQPKPRELTKGSQYMSLNRVLTTVGSQTTVTDNTSTDKTIYKCSETMVQWLRDNGINSTLIIDAAVGYIMEKIDIVLVGAEGVAESGGIINKVMHLITISD